MRAAYFLVAAVAPGMVERGTGSIINLDSMAGTVGLAGGAAYGATKAAFGRGAQVKEIAEVIAHPERDRLPAAADDLFYAEGA